MIRETRESDQNAILAIVRESGQFDADALEHVEATLHSYLEEGTSDLWFTADDGEPVGVALCSPEPVSSGTWNLLMLWIRSDRHNAGHGSALVENVEEELRNRNARLLIVETSGLPDFAPARSFYRKCQFIEEARIRNFFADGDDKIVFTRNLC